MPPKLIINRKHLENAQLGKRGLKPKVENYQNKRVDVTLEQEANREWFIRFGKSTSRFPTTDAEVSLWLRIQELEKKLRDA